MEYVFYPAGWDCWCALMAIKSKLHVFVKTGTGCCIWCWLGMVKERKTIQITSEAAPFIPEFLLR